MPWVSRHCPASPHLCRLWPLLFIVLLALTLSCSWIYSTREHWVLRRMSNTDNLSCTMLHLKCFYEFQFEVRFYCTGTVKIRLLLWLHSRYYWQIIMHFYDTVGAGCSSLRECRGALYSSSEEKTNVWITERSLYYIATHNHITSVLCQYILIKVKIRSRCSLSIFTDTILCAYQYTIGWGHTPHSSYSTRRLCSKFLQLLQ